MEISRHVIEERKANFEDFFESSISGLVSFVESLGISPAHEILNQPKEYISLLDTALSNLKIESAEDRNFLIFQIGFYFGMCLASTYSGHWKVEENPNGKFYGRYVVSEFKNSTPNTVVDPFEMGAYYVSSFPALSLKTVLSEAEQELFGHIKASYA